jgi:hypothetical protein
VRELRERRRAFSGENYIIAERHFGLAENSWYVEELVFFRLLSSLCLSLSSLFFPFFFSFGRQFLTVPFCSFKRAGRDEQQQRQFFTVRFRASKPAGREQQQERITENGKRLICSREEREEKENKNKKSLWRKSAWI